MEHDLRRTGPISLGLLLILFLLPFGSSRAEEETSPAPEESLPPAESSPAWDGTWEERFLATARERDGEAYRAALETLLSEREDPRARAALASYRYALGAYEGAAEDFRRAADRLAGGEREEALCWRGASLAAAGRIEEALGLLLRVARGEGRPAERARFLAAQVRLREGEARRAAETAAPLLEREGDYALPSLLLYARALFSSGRAAEARAAFDAVIDRAPGSAEAVEARRFLRLAEEAGRGGGDGRYFVQIASFSDGENARRYLEERRAEGMGALSIVLSSDGEKTLHQVRIGPFDDREEAEGARERLAAQGIDGRVVRRDGE